jgi:hypothetical protein
METKTLPDLKAMKPWPETVSRSTNVEIANPEHFARTMQFASDNGLSEQFATTFARLMQLVAQQGGVIWPDDLKTPSFVWRGCGMVGGFIFHASSREWSIHT